VPVITFDVDIIGPQQFLLISILTQISITAFNEILTSHIKDNNGGNLELYYP